MDSHSVISDQSASSKHLECPCCRKPFASRSVFHHIRTRHSGFFQQQTTKVWLQEAQKGKPLKVFWNCKNDFDEEDTVVLFGCLSSGKTFNLEHKALTHFKRNPKDLQEHNKQIELLIKTREADLEKERKDKLALAGIPPEKSEYIEMKKDNNPELCGALLEVVKNHLEVCNRLAVDAKHYLDMEWQTRSPETPGTQKTQSIKESIDILEKVNVWVANGPTTYKVISNILCYLWRFLQIRKFFNGHTAPELPYPWYNSLDHPEGELSIGNSRFAKYIWPWESPMNPIDSPLSGPC